MHSAKIIVVEDEAIVALNLRQQLRKLGYDVVATAASGEAALRAIAETWPDLILMDINLQGDIDGIETTARIPEEVRPPVIYLTAHAEDATLERARRTKPYGYLMKPTFEQELHATIVMVLERRKSEVAIEASEQRLRLALDAAEMGTWELDSETRAIVPAGRTHEILGLREEDAPYSLDAFLGRLHEADRPLATRTFAALLADDAPHRVELRRTGADGHIRWLQVQARACALERGVRRIIGVVQDITERRQIDEELARHARELDAEVQQRRKAEAALRSTTETLTKVIDASPLAIIAIDERELVTIWNPAAERTYGIAATEMLGQRPEKSWSKVMLPGAPTQRDIWRRVRQEREIRGVEVRRVLLDGSVRDFYLSAAVLDDGDGPGGILFVTEDITQRKATEEQLRQLQKLEAVGQLTGGIAHDFNNLLAVVQGNLELLNAHASAIDALSGGLVTEALDATQRGASLTHRLLAYSRRQQLEPSLTDIEKLIGNLVGLLRRVIPESIRVETLVAPGAWKTLIDAHQLENALLNLAVNARDAMPEGGALTIAVENAILDEDYAGQNPEVNAGSYVMVSVSDTGTGMPKEIVDRAVEPFFTTKPVGHGTGLGLSMVYGFVKQSGGHLKIYSEPGHGTTVKLYLPMARSGQEPDDVKAGAKPVAVSTGEHLILVVDDDASIRRLEVRMLNSLGYKSVVAEAGPAGLAALEANPDIDLLLTDIVLPGGMSGPALADAANQMRPELKVVFMSGYAPAGVIRPEALKNRPFLSKPFTKADLADAVREALEGGGSA